jgi:hypothetical protein
MKLTKEELIEIIKEEVQNEGIMDLLKKDKREPARNPKAMAAEEMLMMARVFKNKVIPAIEATQGTSERSIKAKEAIMKEFDLERLAELMQELGYTSVV